ncbi:MAG: ribonuclease HII [Lachnospiraceae bacterium]|nr:ribonuclease HII [Lachnospiraceae bacterium]
MAEKIERIKDALQNAAPENLEEVMALYREDTRSGVKKLIEQAGKRKEKFLAECARVDKMLVFEREYKDYRVVCGIDEVGRGPLAGPVVAAAVVLPADCRILYLNDSKQLSEKKREELFPEIMEKAVACGIGCVSHTVIDEINILQATYQAMREALVKMAQSCGAPDVLLNDAVTIPGVQELFPEKKERIRQVPIVKGDAKCLSIAAASVVAKVTRDHMMEAFDRVHPGYGFTKNKGYGSAEHIEKLKKDGPCPIHRRSFLTGILGEDGR